MITITTWLHYKLKPLQPLFSECKSNRFINSLLSDKHNQTCSKSPHQYRLTLNKMKFFCKKKLIQVSPARTVTICGMHKSNRCFCIFLDLLGDNNFWYQSFISKYEIFSFQNCCLGEKRRSKVVKTFQKFLETETFLTNLKHKHLVTWLL